jgi:hypothetical protein
VNFGLLSKKQRLAIGLSSTALTAIAAGILHASGTAWHVASVGFGNFQDSCRVELRSKLIT